MKHEPDINDEDIDKINLLKVTESQLNKSQEYLNKLNGISNILIKRKKSIIFPGIKSSSHYRKLSNNDNQKGGSLSDNSSSELTSDDDTNKLYIQKNELIIKNQRSLLKKIYNKMKSLDKENPDYELQLADLNNKYDVINNQIKYLQKLNEIIIARHNDESRSGC